MALVERITLRRGQDKCADTSPVWIWIGNLIKVLRPIRHPHLKDLSAHHLRDIGLSELDQAPLTHRLPSQHTHHPRG